MVHNHNEDPRKKLMMKCQSLARVSFLPIHFSEVEEKSKFWRGPRGGERTKQTVLVTVCDCYYYHFTPPHTHTHTPNPPTPQKKEEETDSLLYRSHLNCIDNYCVNQSMSCKIKKKTLCRETYFSTWNLRHYTSVLQGYTLSCTVPALM